MKTSDKNKKYVIRKYVYAKSVASALKKERDIKPDDAWIDEDWKKDHGDFESRSIVFRN